MRRDPRGKWIIFIEKGGERKNKTIGTGRESLAKAIKAAEAIAPQLDSTIPAKPVDQSKCKAPRFQEYSEGWLEENAGRWDLQTYKRYEVILRLHIRPYAEFKGKRMDEIQRQDVKKRLRELLRTHSSSSVELAHTVLCGIFGEAIDDRIIEFNPAPGLLKKLSPPKNKRYLKEPDPFDLEERNRFLAHAEKICTWTEQLILKVMVHAGPRLGEALAMRIRHLDLVRMI